MSLFSAAAQAALAGQSIGAAILVEMSFRTGVERLWLGAGDLVTYAGGEKTWRGAGDLVAISEIPAASGTEATQVTLTLSGDWAEMPGLVAQAATSADEAEGRAVTIWLQLGVTASGFSLLDEPVALWTGTMDRIETDITAASARATLYCESLFTDRRRPRFALLTHSDQQLRSPGDMFLEFVSTLQFKDVQWPTF